MYPKCPPIVVFALSLPSLLCATLTMARAQDTLPLAYRLSAIRMQTAIMAPALADKSSKTNFFFDQTANRGTYNAQFVAVTALLASDDAGLSKTLVSSDGSNTHKGANDITKLGDATYVAPALAVLYMVGGSRNQTLAWHAALAAAKAGIVGIVAKSVIGRSRPYDGGSASSFSPFSTSSNRTSFPSGHSIVAFSVATVWAHDKPNEKYLAYGLASLVGLSRLTLGAHWPTDVLIGATLGISQGRQVNNGNTQLFSLKF